MKLEKQNLFRVNNRPVDVNIHLEQGLYLLTGENGIGKTSFFNFLKENKDTLGFNQAISFMDQFPISPINEIRLKDVLGFFNQSSRQFSLELAMSLIARYKITYLLERPMHLYSGGENQISKFILMYCQNVDFYFLDEPLQYLDQSRIEKMKVDLSKLSEDKTVVIIEHRGEYLEDLKPKSIRMINLNERIELNGN